RDPYELSEPLAGDGFDEVDSLAFTPDGATLVSSGTATQLWNVTDPTRPRRIGSSLTGDRAGVAFALSGNGRIWAVVVSGEPTEVILWDIADSLHPHRVGPAITEHVQGEHAVALSRDGRMLATGGGVDDPTIVLWDLTRLGQPRRIDPPLLGHSDW